MTTSSVELLAPGSVQRPPHIAPADWARMPWPARLKAARRAVTTPTAQAKAEPEPRGTYRGGPVAEQPCGTYAAYRRHRRRGETPCEPCRVANRTDTNQRYFLKHGRRRRSGLDLELVDAFVRDEALWDDLSVEERIEAARRMDANGMSRRAIARRTHLSTANLRRAFAERAAEEPGLAS